ncbi:hypothetical protein QTG54_002892 [Skeletonema marinoi]|uniref:Uncharacterized protein n=1 Tax=Skeletonema marinoi TaxID=267567 RepID=A0AAD8YJL6_9STRA|nr:hypothetical protein QTG54_002892 [Skeletonema marinoi]
MVIDITDDTPATADESKNNNIAVQIKRDPGAASAPQNTNDVDDDSEVEIISPSRLKKPAAADTNILEVNDDDDIQITSSNLTAPNVVFPHHRSLCGVHKFTPLSIIDNSDNAKFCTKCFCLLCDVPASQCKDWESNRNNPTVGPHCHAHNGDEKWTNLLKAKRDAAAATSGTTAATAAARPPPTRNPYQRPQQHASTSNNNSAYSSTNHQQIEQLIHNEFLSRLATNDTNNNSINLGNNKEERLRSRKEMRIRKFWRRIFKRL